jgi:hypothetical protein
MKYEFLNWSEDAPFFMFTVKRLRYIFFAFLQCDGFPFSIVEWLVHGLLLLVGLIDLVVAIVTR